jgi:hypothetical protein
MEGLNDHVGPAADTTSTVLHNDIIANLEDLQLVLTAAHERDDETAKEVLETPPSTLPVLALEPSSTLETTLTMPDEDFERSSSPSLALSPTLALDACPHLDRSVSTASSNSSRSRRSSSSQITESSVSGKRRGYMRPQATTYAESARNRDSVMSLGTIAHLQYYFARTGLLDGKGAQFAKENAQNRSLSERKSSIRRVSAATTSRASSMSLPETSNMFLSASPGDNYAISDTGLTDSPIEQGEDVPNWDQEPLMLPPTVSTYNSRPIYVQPPPDVKMLRRELTEALEDALKVLKESDKGGHGVYSYLRHGAIFSNKHDRLSRLV